MSISAINNVGKSDNTVALLVNLLLAQLEGNQQNQNIFDTSTVSAFNPQTEADYVAASSEASVYRVLGLQIPSMGSSVNLPTAEELDAMQKNQKIGNTENTASIGTSGKKLDFSPG